MIFNLELNDKKSLKKSEIINAFRELLKKESIVRENSNLSNIYTITFNNSKSKLEGSFIFNDLILWKEIDLNRKYNIIFILSLKPILNEIDMDNDFIFEFSSIINPDILLKRIESYLPSYIKTQTFKNKET